MKISQLVAALKGVQKGFGDLDVCVRGTGRECLVAFEPKSLTVRKEIEIEAPSEDNKYTVVVINPKE